MLKHVPAVLGVVLMATACGSTRGLSYETTGEEVAGAVGPSSTEDVQTPPTTAIPETVPSVASSTVTVPSIDSTTADSTTSDSTTTAPTTTIAPTATSSPTEIAPTTESPYTPGVLVIGDSILEGMNLLGYTFGPNTIFDTEVSRSAIHLPTYLTEHEVPANLIIHLGTNGWWSETGQIFSESLASLEGRRVVLLNLHVDRSYETLANEQLRTVASENEAVTLVDWNSVAEPRLLRSDGYHPNFEGFDVLSRLIADALGLPADAVLQVPTTVESRPTETESLLLD